MHVVDRRYNVSLAQRAELHPAATPFPDDTAIRSAAENARALLRACEALPDRACVKVADAQLTRFSLWASNIGVWAPRQASLDYRLRAALAPKAAVEGSLEILCKHLLTGKSSLSYYPV
jgi:hypothetical protein